KREMFKIMEWSDVSFFEWCDELLIEASKLRKVCKVVCRLHSYEAYTNLPNRVNWKNVDDLIFVAPHVKEITKLKLPWLEDMVKTHIIYNGVDLDRYKFKEGKGGFDLAYVGHIRYVKNPSLLLQCIKILVDADSNYRLHLACEFIDLETLLYFEHMTDQMGLRDNIVIYSWTDKIEEWLEDKNYVLSTSIRESFGYNIAEAMAMGIKPLIHNWPGAKNLYPKKYLFNTIDKFKNMVINGEYNSREYREHIEKNYSLEVQLRKIEDVILS
ncbi:glycosyltransferase, partial [bacterium]|nr:glycosyltransferase [bacterium]